MKKRLIALVITVAVLLTLTPATLAVNDKPLVIILPGIIASDLENADAVVWPPIDLDIISIMEPAANTSFDVGALLVKVKSNIEALRYADGKPVNALTAVQNYGTFGTYQKLTEQLEYDGFDAVVFCYDWRQPNKDSAVQLAEFIGKYRNREITLVGHSMGGLVICDYIEAHPNDHGIAGVITLGTPYLGSSNAITAISSGSMFGNNFPAAVSMILNPTIASVAATLPSIAELMPRDSYEIPGYGSIPWYAFYGYASADELSDGTVTIKSATNDGKIENTYGVKDTHSALAYNEAVIAAIEQIIIDGQPSYEWDALPVFQAYAGNSRLAVDGEVVNLTTYAITTDDTLANYVKLRDIAAALKDKFNIDYNDGVVTLLPNAAYTPVGEELTAVGDAEVSAFESTDTFMLNGEAEELTAYKINGYNYVRLPELSRILGLELDIAEPRM